jgi:hypothetical protein
MYVAYFNVLCNILGLSIKQQCVLCFFSDPVVTRSCKKWLREVIDLAK